MMYLVAKSAIRAASHSASLASRRFSGSSSVEKKLSKLGIALPEVSSPQGSYRPTQRVGNNLIFTAGQLPVRPDGSMHRGKVGDNVTVAEAQEAARRCAVQMLAAVREDVARDGGSLDDIRVRKVVGFVNATPDFTEHPAVMNGCSDFLFEALGEAGLHSRSAVGVGSLPLGVPVEVEFVVEYSRTDCA